MLNYGELETLLEMITKDLAKRLLVDKSASVDVEKPDLEDEVINQHDAVEDDADEATTVEDFHNLVPTKKWRGETRNVRKGDIILIMYNGKSKSAENNTANRVDYMVLVNGVQYKEVVDVKDQVVVTDGGKQGTITRQKVDVKKSA